VFGLSAHQTHTTAPTNSPNSCSPRHHSISVEVIETAQETVEFKVPRILRHPA